METPEFESVYEPGDSVTADLAKGVLESEGIPVVVQSFQVAWYGGMRAPSEGGAWGRILVPVEHAARARETLDAYFAGKPEPDAAPPAEEE